MRRAQLKFHHFCIRAKGNERKQHFCWHQQNRTFCCCCCCVICDIKFIRFIGGWLILLTSRKYSYWEHKRTHTHRHTHNCCTKHSMTRYQTFDCLSQFFTIVWWVTGRSMKKCNNWLLFSQIHLFDFIWPFG